jgi:hypothetical protein
MYLLSYRQHQGAPVALQAGGAQVLMAGVPSQHVSIASGVLMQGEVSSASHKGTRSRET